MKFFSMLYQKMLRWSAHRHAPKYLAAVSFAESSFFPIPPDIMLISMGLAAPCRVWRFAFITSLASVLGGMFGYVLGMFFFHLIHPLMIYGGYEQSYQHVTQWFQHWGIWIVFVAGFSPIPYKMFTITAGVMHMSFIPFVIASLVARSLRFYLVSGLMHWGGERIHEVIHRYVDLIGWATVILLAIALSIWGVSHFF